MGVRAKLTPRQEQAVAVLLGVPDHAQAAALIGCGVSTLRRWLADPAFQAAYRAARRAVVEQAVAQLQRASGEAVAALHRNLNAPRPGDQIKAALGILDRAARGVELIELAERLAALERRLGGPAAGDEGGAHGFTT